MDQNPSEKTTGFNVTRASTDDAKKSANPKDIFNTFLQKKRIFKNKEVLSSSFRPESIPHRDSEIETLSNILAPSLLLERVSNLLIYGFSGTGKTLVTKYVAQNLGAMAADKNVNVLPLYINCRMGNMYTEYQLMTHLCTVLGIKTPTSGLSVKSLYDKLRKAIDTQDRYLILILDEIEKLIQHAGDGALYSLLRLNESMDRAKLSIIGISNNTDLKASLDQRVRSSLSPIEIVFRPYNAIEIEDILSTRAKEAFFDHAVGIDVMRKCAALAAQEHGDIRKALNMLKVAGEQAQQVGRSTVTEEDLDKASGVLEQNITEEVIKSMTKQHKCVLLSIIEVARHKRLGKVYSGEVYDYYHKIAERYGLKELTFRRVSDLIADMDYNSLVMSRVVSHGRQGRTRELNVAFSASLLGKVEGIIRDELN